VPTPPEAMTGMVDGVGDGAGQGQVVARPWCRRGPCWSGGFRPRPLRGDVRAKVYGVDPGGAATAVGEDLPFAGGDGLGVDGDDDALAAETVGGADHVGVGDGGRVEADLVGPGEEQLAHVLGVRTPPPTVRGMKHCSAVRVTRSNIVARFSVAMMSRKQSSSAPAAS
jgi:hypothetical protein